MKRLYLVTTGSSKRPTSEMLRLLVAAGILYQATDISFDVDAKLLHQSTAQSLVAGTVWPIIIAPRLPSDWFDVLQELSSPQIAALVYKARQSAANNNTVTVFHDLLSDLSPENYRAGYLNLWEDMTDRHRGFPAFDAVYAMTRVAPLPRKGGAKDLFDHVYGKSAAAMYAAAGGGVTAAAGILWSELVNPAAASSPTHDSSFDSSSDGGHSGQHTTDHPIVSFVVNWIVGHFHQQ